MRAKYLFVILGAAGLVGLALALAVALLPGCGVRLGPLGDLDFCVSRAAVGVSLALEAELERSAALQERVRGLERRLAGLPACAPPPSPPSLYPSRSLNPISTVGRRALARTGHSRFSRDAGRLPLIYSIQRIGKHGVEFLRWSTSWQMCFDDDGTRTSSGWSLRMDASVPSNVTAAFHGGRSSWRVRRRRRMSIVLTIATFIAVSLPARLEPERRSGLLNPSTARDR